MSKHVPQDPSAFLARAGVQKYHDGVCDRVLCRGKQRTASGIERSLIRKSMDETFAVDDR